MILFFDTETTGIRKGGFIPRVVQIGALLTDNNGKTLSELNVLLYPEGFENVPVEASNVHGFTTDTLKQRGVDGFSALNVFFELFKHADVVVAHNAEFDMDLIQIEADRVVAQSPYDHEKEIARGWQEEIQKATVFCTMLNSRDIMKLPLSEAQARFFKDTGNTQQYKNPRLQEAYIHFMGHDFDGAHDAMADVRACADVYFKLHSLKEEVAA